MVVVFLTTPHSNRSRRSKAVSLISSRMHTRQHRHQTAKARSSVSVAVATHTSHTKILLFFCYILKSPNTSLFFVWNDPLIGDGEFVT